MSTRTKWLYGKLLVPILLLLALGAMSCGGKSSSTGGETTGTLSVSIEWVPPPYYATHDYSTDDEYRFTAELFTYRARPAAYPDNVCDEYGVEYVLLTVAASDGSIKSKQFFCNAHSGTIDVNVGSNYTLKVEAIGAGVVDETWWGQSDNITVQQGQTSWVNSLPLTWKGSTVRPPGIDMVSTYPGEGDTDVNINTSILVKFDKSIVKATVDNTSFMLNEGGNAVNGSVTYDSIHKIAKFIPSQNLQPNRVYTVNLYNTITDFANLPLPNKAWSFTTSGSSDTIPPFVVSTNPANNAENVSVNPSVTVKFSEMMDTESVSSGITMTDNVGTPVPGQVTYNNSDNSAVFVPSATLKYLTLYNLKVSTSVKDLAGNFMTADNVVHFLTSAASLQSIAVTPANPSVVTGAIQQFAATGTYSDSSTLNLTTSVTWDSSNTSVATISNALGSNGRATALAAGNSIINASLGSIFGTTTLTVTSPVYGIWDTSTWDGTGSIWAP